MASFCYRIRSTQKNKLVKIQILFTVGRGNQFYADCQYMVPVSYTHLRAHET